MVLNASEGSLPPFPALDPFFLVEGDIVRSFNDIIADLMDTEHPMLSSVVCFVFSLHQNATYHISVLGRRMCCDGWLRTYTLNNIHIFIGKILTLEPSWKTVCLLLFHAAER